MLRHSVSQVFGFNHPALSARGDDDMPQQPRPFDITTTPSPSSSSVSVSFGSGAQPRTQLPSSSNNNNNNNNNAIPPPNASSALTQEPLLLPLLPPLPSDFPEPIMPVTQPPLPRRSIAGSHAPMTTNAASLQARQPRDASNLHPVFFTERLLRRSALAVDAASTTNPAAHGYVYQGARWGDAIPAML
ncbi:uncharacterized protein GGS25DRAFT_493603 [Hypoxylon fragiforme]|uniref:uncharacterized protein n=1 Tax=Hypoxylon fragiforme TaxID=63214 RepID=UPI0020C6A871|nr:uncharacterized protein GGS25DRAFT_493603 [Hypoxylon fragiforme]KAI2606878.1 hypothetical protein GGS25DRAFT_493603 [Hypoxylon fragiforme]